MPKLGFETELLLPFAVDPIKGYCIDGGKLSVDKTQLGQEDGVIYSRSRIVQFNQVGPDYLPLANLQVSVSIKYATFKTILTYLNTDYSDVTVISTPSPIAAKLKYMPNRQAYSYEGDGYPFRQYVSYVDDTGDVKLMATRVGIVLKDNSIDEIMDEIPDTLVFSGVLTLTIE